MTNDEILTFDKIFSLHRMGAISDKQLMKLLGVESLPPRPLPPQWIFGVDWSVDCEEARIQKFKRLSTERQKRSAW